MSLSETNGECSFSFTKKPIDTPLPIHSTISDILEAKQGGRFDSPESVSPNTTNKLNINVNSKNTINESKDFKKSNNINYDEQIRAPRFNLFNQVNLSGENVQRSYSFSYKEDDKKDPEIKKESQEPQSVYVPANFDLNNYTYAASVANEPTSDATQGSNITEAIHNLNDNLTSFEREDFDSVDQGGPKDPEPDKSKKFIKPVYQFKRPLSIPAVLRPPDPEPLSSNSSSNRSSGASLNSSGNLKLDLSNLNQRDTIDLLVNFENLDENVEPIEPTRVHWKPNKFTNCCMRCFKNFGNFFNMKRRHHCRFCGFLICSNCLFEMNTPNYRIPIQESAVAAATAATATSTPASSNSTKESVSPSKKSNSVGDANTQNINLIYLDSKARFIIPIFKNLNFLNIDINSLNRLFKLSKICNNCGEYYLNLLLNLNNLSVNSSELDNDLNRNLNQLKLPFVVIENPFINKTFSKSETNHRKNSIVNSNDWNWSSF